MTRTELTIAIALALALAAVAGWALHWLWARMLRGGGRDLAEHSDMAELLHEAKLERDAAAARERETDARLTAERHEAEARLNARIAEREAELAATMDTLGTLRREIVDWRRAYEALQRHDQN
jgi:hypothetical protein